jgi:hypothetical protein
VEVKDDVRRVSARHVDVDDRHASERAFGRRDVLRNGDQLHHLLEDLPLLPHVTPEIQRRVAEQRV